jgi:hypothetical protein
MGTWRPGSIPEWAMDDTSGEGCSYGSANTLRRFYLLAAPSGDPRLRCEPPLAGLLGDFDQNTQHTIKQETNQVRMVGCFNGNIESSEV